jgi:hypothetical protein
MTDHSGATDRVADTLTALRTDTDRLALPDSGSVRRRGEQRTRNQVVGSTLAVAALVAGALGVAGSLSGSDQSIQGPPGDGRSATADVTQKAADPPFALADEPLLDPADVSAYTPLTGWQASPDESAADQPFLQCLDTPSDLGAPETAKRLFYLDGQQPTATEHVLRFPSAVVAETAMADLRDQLVACGERTTGDVRPVQDTTDGFRYSQSSADAGSEVSYVEIDAARRVNLVVVLQWNGAVDHVSAAQDTWVWDAPVRELAFQVAIG